MANEGILYHYAVVQVSPRKYAVMRTFTSKLEGEATYWKVIKVFRSWGEANKDCRRLLEEGEE